MQDIWDSYDNDGSGTLDKEEARKFVGQTLTDTGTGSFSDAEFDECFNQFDKNGDGVISKGEMVQFIKSVANI